MNNVFAVVSALGLIGFCLLGVIGAGWEGTKENRSAFWNVFLPCLGGMLGISFTIGRMTA